LPWTGELPGVRECRAFGWYARSNPGGWHRCEPNEPGAEPDIRRLAAETEWNCDRKRRVRTTLTEAFAEMGRRNLIYSRAEYIFPAHSIHALTMQAHESLKRGEQVVGYACYTSEDEWKKVRGEAFELHYGGIELQGGLPNHQVGEIVVDCLHYRDIALVWDIDRNLVTVNPRSIRALD
jgi:hypothetical protein